MTSESVAEILAQAAEIGEFDGIRTRNFGKHSSKSERMKCKKLDHDHTRRLVNNWRNNDLKQRRTP